MAPKQQRGSPNDPKDKVVTYPYRVTMALRKAFILGQTPATLQKWQGYFRYQDVTIQPANSLTYPSQNCFIPMKDKIVPRLGTTLLGAPFTANQQWPIVGHKKRFTTMGGFDVEVRVTKTNDVNLKDVIEVLYPDPVTNVLTWFQITESVNPLTAGVHRYYFDDWFDSNLNPAESLNLSRLIWVNGLAQIFSWTGGIAPIVSLVANVSISTTAGVSWASLGFVDPALGGTGNIIVNGVQHVVSGGWSTDTLLIANTTGISVNNVALAQIQTDATTIPFDMCRQNKNYMFYGNWKSQRLFMSNKFSHDSTASLVSSQALQNDLVVGTSLYTGTGSHVYKVTIDSISPNVNIQTFTGSGVNDASYDISGYSGTSGVLNVYKMVVVANFSLRNTVVAGTFQIGEVIKGGTSGALGTIVGNNVITVGVEQVFGLSMISGSFVSGETITGQSTGATATVNNTGNRTIAQNWVQFLKNGITQSITVGAFTGTINPIGSPPFAIPFSLLINLTDGLKMTFSNAYGHQVGDFWELDIRQRGVDTFQWQIDGGTPTTGVAITGGLQTLSLGLQISFVSKNGHQIGDFWNIQVNQSITKAWTNFYYTLPVRAPGEGYIFQLQANFWTMAPQETQMYINTAFGHWLYIDTKLSANLQSESVIIEPLKQPSASKVIYPYMITNTDNSLIYVTENKTLDQIQRMKFVELPQIGNLSDPVKLDFLDATFTDGSMEWFDKKLWITSPHEGTMLVWDNLHKYWQPPQLIPENGILSIVGNTLISHSFLRNQSFNLFTGTAGDNGAEYKVLARTPADSHGSRWTQKNSNASFIDGYVTGAPPMTMTLYMGINGCKRVAEHAIAPIICISPNNAPLGEESLGAHSLGSDKFNQDSYFNEIYQRYLPILQYYFIAIELECTTTAHTYSWLTIGVNSVTSNTGNTDLLNKEVLNQDLILED